MKPDELVHCPVSPTQINSYLIKKIEIDLRHINYGLDQIKGYRKRARSHFKAEDIVSFFEALNNLEILTEQDDEWEYFVVDRAFFGHKGKYRMVFCIDRRNPTISGIITMFQLKRK